MNRSTLVALALMAHTAPLMAADDIIEPPMAAIPAGSFTMGAATSMAPPDYPAELPAHQVNVPAFQMAKYEVTVKQYKQFVDATGHKGQSTCWVLSNNEWGMENRAVTWDRPAHLQGDFHPVLCVSWDDARAYAAWLAEKTGKPYRLPSEAEWEYAARAGSTALYHFGADDALACRFGNIRDLTGRAAIAKITGKEGKQASCDDGVAFTAMVGSYLPNQFGLYDMVGNVGEIVEDCEHLNYEGAPSDGSAWTSACKNAMRMTRGGNFNSIIGARSTARGHTGNDNASTFEGFRVALSQPAPTRMPASAQRFEHELTKARKAGAPRAD